MSRYCITETPSSLILLMSKIHFSDVNKLTPELQYYLTRTLSNIFNELIKITLAPRSNIVYENNNFE